MLSFEPQKHLLFLPAIPEHPPMFLMPHLDSFFPLILVKFMLFQNSTRQRDGRHIRIYGQLCKNKFFSRMKFNHEKNLQGFHLVEERRHEHGLQITLELFMGPLQGLDLSLGAFKNLVSWVFASRGFLLLTLFPNFSECLFPSS